MRKTYSDAYNTGYEARIQGEPRNANPYAAGTWERDQWADGWDNSQLAGNPQPVGNKRLRLSDLHNVDAGRLTTELAAAGWDSSLRDLDELRGAVARLLHEFWGPFDLTNEDNDVIREATEQETVDSVMSGPEGWIVVDGLRCYVAE